LEIHDQRTHHRAGILGHFTGERINVGHQAVAQFVEFDDGLIRRTGVSAKSPRFTGLEFAVQPRDRAECSELKPAGI
jgi:hypothetical protein